jgi:hypothetical protein
MRKLVNVSLALAAFAAPLLVPSTASAGIDSCGNIHVEANAQCEVKAGVECKAECTPIRFEAACAAELYVDCAGSCEGTASATCTGSCDVAGCEARCTANPGEFNCSVDCAAQAEAHCSGECSAAANKGECQASCKATFSGRCDSHCEGTPPSATCKARCEASCQGKCEAEANVDCHVTCQSDGYVDCKADLKGGCELDCDSESAMFCDDNYVDHGGNLQKCIDALKAEINITVDASASGECSGNQCSGEAEASCACSAPARSDASGLAWLGALGVLGAVCARRRRR